MKKLTLSTYLFLYLFLTLCGWNLSCISTNLSESEISNEKIYTNSEIPPCFSGCSKTDWNRHEKMNCTKEKVNDFIYSHLEYPQKSIGKKGGYVTIQFVIDKQGNIINLEIVRDKNGFGDAVLKVFKNMPRWTPGIHMGVPVHVKKYLSIRIEEEQYLMSDTFEPLKSDDGNFVGADKMAYFSKCEGIDDSNKHKCNKRYTVRHVNNSSNSLIELGHSGPLGSCLHYLSFVVDKEGNVTNAEAGCGQPVYRNKAVEKALNSMPQWVPAQHNGEPVNVKIVLPYRGIAGY